MRPNERPRNVREMSAAQRLERAARRPFRRVPCRRTSRPAGRADGHPVPAAGARDRSRTVKTDAPPSRSRRGTPRSASERQEARPSDGRRRRSGGGWAIVSGLPRLPSWARSVRAERRAGPRPPRPPPRPCFCERRESRLVFGRGRLDLVEHPGEKRVLERMLSRERTHHRRHPEDELRPVVPVGRPRRSSRICRSIQHNILALV